MIPVVVDRATPAIDRVHEFLSSQDALAVAGATGVKVTQAHLQTLDETRPNTLGGRRTHYYGDARRATSFKFMPNGVLIHIGQVGMRLHYYGGTVTAGKGISSATGQPTRFLTIPACAEAYGHRASEFDLTLVFGTRGPYALALAMRQDSFDARTGEYRSVVRPGKIMFTLRESVHLDPDPTVIPDQTEYTTAIGTTLRAAVRRRFRGQVVDPNAEFMPEI